MKNIKKIIFCASLLLSFNMFVYAECKNEELNEWATVVQAKFIEVTDENEESSEYAYLLTITPLRDDVVIRVTDGNGAKATGKLLSPGPNQEKIQAVGCYTNLEEEKYTIEVLGGKNTGCENEVLKTLEYTVPRYNRYVKDKNCVGSDSELCATFTNLTKDMSEADFREAVGEENNEKPNDNNDILSKILGVIVNYGLYIIIPLVAVSVFYGIKIGKFKKEEREK